MSRVLKHTLSKGKSRKCVKCRNWFKPYALNGGIARVCKTCVTPRAVNVSR